MIAIAYHWRRTGTAGGVVEHDWGGMATHYSVLRKSLIDKHQSRGQKVGTAFPTSRNCLFRELNRGVDYIFSNHAVSLQNIVKKALSVST